jgi:hypothetical protein
MDTNRITDRNILPIISASLVIVLLCILYYFSYTNTCFFNSYLFGSWESDETFNHLSDLKQFKLFIGDVSSPISDNIRNCYIIIKSDNIDISQVAYIRFSDSSLFSFTPTLKTYHIHIDFEENTESISSVLPSDLLLDLDTTNGFIKLYTLSTNTTPDANKPDESSDSNSDGKLYAVLYKDTSSSHLLSKESYSILHDNPPEI